MAVKKKVTKKAAKKKASAKARERMQIASVDGRTTRTKRDAKSCAQTDAPGGRTAWTGFSRDELQNPDLKLLVQLFQAANERGHTLRELAEHLGVSYGYLHQLRTGMRQTRHVSDEMVENCAAYLGVPKIAIHLMSGRVQPEDFYEDPALVQRYVDNAIKILRKDPDYAPLLPPDIEASSYENKRLITLLYERATGISVLPEAVDVDDLIKKIRK